MDEKKALTDEQLTEMHEDQFGLFCDLQEFIDIARTIEMRHRIFRDKEIKDNSWTH